MITIRKMSLLATLLYLVLLFFGLLAVRAWWFYPQELEIVRTHQHHEIAGIARQLEQQANHLLAFATDYAEWDDTYDFLGRNDGLNPSVPYMRTNFVADTFLNLNVQHAILATASGELRISLRHFISSGNLQRSLPSLEQWLTQQIRGQNYQFIAQPASYQHIDGHNYLLAVAPVSRSDGSGDTRGYLLLARTIADTYWGTLSHSDHIRIQANANPPTSCAPIYEHIRAARTIHQRCLQDATGRASIMLTFNHAQSLPPLLKPAVFASFIVIAILPSVLFYVFLKAIINPIVHATQHLRDNRSKGEFSPIRFSDPFHIRELIELKNSYNAVVKEINRQKNQLLEMSNTDRLTGIHNRRSFEEALVNTWQRLHRHSDGMALVLCDIDFFKRFNDHYGHIAGDEALRLVALALASCVRRADELAARYGGEEFILITYLRHQDDLEQLRKRLQQAIANLHIDHGFSDTSDKLTVSAGIAWIPNPGSWLQSHSATDWVQAADHALYKAKNSGRNQSVVHLLSSPEDWNFPPI
ncbi:hypothetical protein CHH28_15920 [Bacterioplanes sanyensis]|uniref:diguanylate cyclase n=1 Tax=Bacterioplanes sanyensis TaxID=1249553 RepID=A0A222FMR6_9GAMM|nr:diguanylate cyclase [Bacterioplanes sanyensis]ASP40070.1 hypothetical protein CHH28_15920 [Bacterioplanes sanyensis]